MTSAKENIVAAALVAGAIVVTYWYVIRGLVDAWSNDDNYSHGFFIVPLAVYFAWERRAAPRAHAGAAIGGWTADRRRQPDDAGGGHARRRAVPVARVALGVIAGAILFLFGWPRLRVLLFPLAFLLLMIPLPAIIFNQIAFPAAAAGVARRRIRDQRAANIPILREGNVLILANATLEVAEACSGIRSLVSLFTLGIVFGYFADSRAWVRAVIALSAIPVAILANGLRVASAGVAAHYYGPGRRRRALSRILRLGGLRGRVPDDAGAAAAAASASCRRAPCRNGTVTA